MPGKPEQTDRHGALNELVRDAEAKWYALTEHSPNHIMLLDTDGTILFMNHSLPGHTSKQVIGTTVYAYLNEANGHAARQAHQEVLDTGQCAHYETIETDAAGISRHSSRLVYPVIVDKKIVALIEDEQDVSAQYQQQQELQKRHALLQTVVSNSPVVIWAIDRFGVFTLSEGAGLKALGLKPGEVVGQSVFDIYKDHEQICEDARQALGGTPTSSVVNVAGRVYQSICVPLRNNQGDISGVIGAANDITEIQQAQTRMNILSSALEQTADLIMITDAEGKIEYVNPAFEVTTGFTREELLGKQANMLRSGKHSVEFYRNLWQTILNGQVFSDVFINTRKDGSTYYEEKTITPIHNAQGVITNFVATGKDISERMRTQERLHYMAHHDALTRLPNRTLFLDRLHQAMTRARWHNRLIAVMFMDLDRFKVINDTLGHDIGDQLLVQITGRISRSVRAGDTVARFGGDEFAILLDDIASEQDISQLAKKILDTLAPAFALSGHEFFITASIGVSIFPTDGEDTESLLRNADVAMYRAKDLGRNNFQFYSNEMSARAFERLALENSLRHALKRKEFFLLYQPQIDLDLQKIRGVEALLRWQHPDLGIIKPTEFISLLEETGLIVPVGEWVLRNTCEQAANWQRAGYDELVVSVNVSGRQLNNPDFLHNAQSIIRQTGVDPARLELELTESMLMRNASKTINALDALGQLGIHFAIDDFGTGYSSLNYLHRFPISTLKIDRSFIRDIEKDADDLAITRAIIVMAQSLNLGVVAEGVENEAQVRHLRSLGCHRIQGNYYSAPLTADKLSEMIAMQST